MKFWQLVSLFRGDFSSLEAFFREENEILYLTWLKNIDEIIRSQDRQILDSVLPDKVIQKAMLISKLKFRIDDGILQVSNDGSPTTEQLSPLEVYTRYGAQAIEDTLEYGAYSVPYKEMPEHG